MKNKLLYAFFSTVFFSCAITTNIKPTSELALNVQFPQKFSIKAMPSNTEKIHIKISGVDLDKPQERDITRQEAGSVIFKGLPIGKKTINIEGFDENNKLVTKGSRNTTIEASKVVTENIELFGLSQKLNFQNYPPNADLAVLEIKGNLLKSPIYKEFNSKNLELEYLAEGEYDVRMTVFDKNALPLGHTKSTIKLDGTEKTITLANEIKLPEISSVIADGLLPIAVPKELFDVLNDILIQVPDNHQPSYDTPVLYVNEVEQKDLPTNKENPICVKKGDTLKVVVKTSDEDKKDNVRIFWGVNSRNADNSLTFRLLNEYGNELSYPVSFDVDTNHSLGFLLTDKKSYVGPFSIYFKVCE